jgi:hypothetical protein
MLKDNLMSLLPQLDQLFTSMYFPLHSWLAAVIDKQSNDKVIAPND